MALNFSTLIGVAPAGAFGTTLAQTATAAAARTALQQQGVTDDGTRVTIDKIVDINPASGISLMRLNRASNTVSAGFDSMFAGTRQWSMHLSDAGGNGNFALHGWNNAGTVLTTWLTMDRVTGQTVFNGSSVNLVSTSNTTLVLNKAADSNFNVIVGRTNNVTRWTVEPGGGGASDFIITRYSDAGANLGTAFTLVRATGQAIFNADLSVFGNVSVGNGTNSGGMAVRKNTDSSGTCYIQSQINTGGNLPRWTMDLANQTTSDFVLTRHNDAGVSQGAVIGIQRNNGTINLYGGVNALNGIGIATGVLNVASGRQVLGQGYNARAGANGGYTNYTVNHNWNGSVMIPYIDDVVMTSIAPASDERIKHSIVELDGDTDKFMAVKPVSYRYKNISIYRDSGEVFYGFTAQNLAPNIPGAVSGDMEAVNAEGVPIPATLNDRAILAQTVLELQKAIRVIEALSARVAELEAA